MLQATARSITSVMEKHTVSTLLHKPEEYSIDMGVLGNVATTFAAAKKTQSVIRMTVVKRSH